MKATHAVGRQLFGHHELDAAVDVADDIDELVGVRTDDICEAFGSDRQEDRIAGVCSAEATGLVAVHLELFYRLESVGQKYQDVRLFVFIPPRDQKLL